MKFDTRFSTSEDTLFISKVLLRTCVYGVSRRCNYMYRKRSDGSSLSQRITARKHFQNLEVCKQLFDDSISEHGLILPYVQATALYIINWQIFGSIDEPFTDDEKREWTDTVVKLIKQIDDKLILDARWMTREKRLFLLYAKYGEHVFERAVWLNLENAYLNGLRVYSLNTASPFLVYAIERVSNLLRIEGTTSLAHLHLPFRLYAKDDEGALSEAQLIPYPTNDYTAITGQVSLKGYRFVIELPIQPGKCYSFFVVFANNPDQELIITPHFSQFGKFDQVSRMDYCVFGDAVIKHRNKQLRIYSYSKKMHIASEIRRIKEIKGDKRFSKEMRRKYIGLRIKYHLKKALHKKPVWLFADKEWKAGDNAENVYRYAMKQSGFHDAEMLFALCKESADYPLVAGYGKVVDPSTDDYLFAFLASSVLVSSRAEQAMVNPFGKRVAMIKDLLSYDFVYLTHGTLFGDLSSMLNKPTKKIRLFSVSTQMERDALLGAEYAYQENEVKILGMARYDGYANAQKKKLVAFLPTWRASIAGKLLPGTSTREYVEHFKDTEYCKFFNALIGNEALIAAFKKYGYKGEFYVHPAFEKQSSDFIGNEYIMVGEGSADYERLLSEASLLVTDYSGVGFDFGYQRKPTVYCQYDSVFSDHQSHTYGEKTYYDYYKDGFGPVATTVEDTVAAIINYLENGCEMENDYRVRADAMFGYSDSQNCKRILDAVIDLEENRGRISKSS